MKLVYWREQSASTEQQPPVRSSVVEKARIKAYDLYARPKFLVNMLIHPCKIITQLEMCGRA